MNDLNETVEAMNNLTIAPLLGKSIQWNSDISEPEGREDTNNIKGI